MKTKLFVRFIASDEIVQQGIMPNPVLCPICTETLADWINDGRLLSPEVELSVLTECDHCGTTYDSIRYIAEEDEEKPELLGDELPRERRKIQQDILRRLGK